MRKRGRRGKFEPSNAAGRLVVVRQVGDQAKAAAGAEQGGAPRRGRGKPPQQHQQHGQSGPPALAAGDAGSNVNLSSRFEDAGEAIFVKFVKFVHPTNKTAHSFTLITLQKALHKHSTFNMLCDGRIVKCMCLHKCIQRVYPNINFTHIEQADASVRIGCIGLSLDIKALAKVQ